MRSPKVFIPQEPRKLDAESGTWVPLYDLTPALVHGSLEVLLPHGPTLIDTDLVTFELRKRLNGYTEADFIMCVGDPVLIAAAVLVAGSLNNGVVTLLKYNRSTKKYNPVTYRS